MGRIETECEVRREEDSLRLDESRTGKLSPGFGGPLIGSRPHVRPVGVCILYRSVVRLIARSRAMTTLHEQ